MIAPSILNADNMKLGENIKTAVEAGIERFHIDIMDGHFVPNLSYGPELVKDFKRAFPLIDAEVHLMSNNLATTLPLFVDAGCDLLEFHFEATDQVEYWLNYLKKKSVKTGLAISPQTPVSAIKPYLDQIDQLLIMTVEPGFGGQSFIANADSRIAEARALIVEKPRKIKIEVDGGIDEQTAPIAKKAGAEIFVAGSYLFRQGPIAEQIAKLERAIE